MRSWDGRTVGKRGEISGSAFRVFWDEKKKNQRHFDDENDDDDFDDALTLISTTPRDDIKYREFEINV